jgi:hypothetical protein
VVARTSTDVSDKRRQLNRSAVQNAIFVKVNLKNLTN